MRADRNSRPDDIARGIGIILASTAAMAFADAVVKLVSSDLTLWQVFVIRSFFAVPCLFLFARWQASRLHPVAIGWVSARSVLLVLTWLAYYASLPVLSLSLAAVAVYANPIVTTLLSAVLLGERVSERQWMGVVVGFVGVTVILKPGTSDFSWAILMPLAAAVLYSSAMVLTRSKCQHENAITLAIGLHLSFLATGAIAVLVLAVFAIDEILLRHILFS